jgi:5-methylcytosine-specific restriction endonuclease McrA|tara:strand:+ start:1065 stop:1709 length:645 start_codon:yes stop_codon:yes gene_type:complete
MYKWISNTNYYWYNKMELIVIDRQHYLKLTTLQQTLGLDDKSFQQNIEQYDYGQNKKLVVVDNAVSCKSACYFLEWFIDNSYTLQPAANSLKHSLRQYTKKIPKRVLSRSMRIEIAYRQRYACNSCQLFPIPPTFEVDHIVELQDGGQDVAENLQALCVTCHRDKTRMVRLRKNPIFRLATIPVPTLPSEIPSETKPSAVFSKYFHRIKPPSTE